MNRFSKPVNIQKTFFWLFLHVSKSQYFFPFWLIIVLIWEKSRNKLEKLGNYTVYCYQKMFWPFTAGINCSSDHKDFENSQPSASNFNSFSWSLEQFFLSVGQKNLINKIAFLITVWLPISQQELALFPNLI